jgi:stage V sporulation protein AD
VQEVRKMGKSTFAFKNDVRILSSAAVAGPIEGEGKLADQFDLIYNDLYMGEESWEKAEQKMLEDAVKFTIQKAKLTEEQIDIYLAGDLLNQNIAASFSARALQIPFMGVYGACSTSMLSLTLATSLVDGGYVNYAIVGTSSHNCSAEKQYRHPTEYGAQKPDTAQWTVTGAGAALVGIGQHGPKIRYATVGKVIERGLKDPFDMGSAMAPAAVDTMQRHFEDTGSQPEDYDFIVTGDLASIGHSIAKELLEHKGYAMGERFQDCGLMIYHSKQKTFAGGSGCASSAIVTYGHLLKQMMKGVYHKILVVATGALFSPVSYQQGEAIPCVAHAVTLEMTDSVKRKNG